MRSEGFSGIVGHERPLKVLRSALSSGRVPQAYLFWGPEGVGKELAARAAAGALLCSAPGALARAEACGACPGCRKEQAGSHPDLHLLAAEGASITIEQVRRLQEALAYQSFERGRKVAIIRDAFRMTREASNALLKTLEEPPAGTHIFLLAHQRNQLLPTLVSRCQALRFDPLDEAQMVRLLEAKGMEASLARRLAAASDGCPGAVLGEDPESLAALGEEVAGVWERMASLGAADRFALSARWAAAKEDLGHRLGTLERFLRARARPGVAPDAEAALDALEGLYRLRRLLEQNVNAQLALDAFLLGMLGGEWEDRP